MSRKAKKNTSTPPAAQVWTPKPVPSEPWAPAPHVPDLQEVLVVSLHGHEQDYYPASNHTWSISTDKDLSIISDTVRVGYYSNSNFISIKGMTIDVAYGMYVLSGRAVVKPEVVEEVREYDEDIVEEAELPE